MFKAYAQKLGPPFSGQVQIVESDTYRAITLDGMMWEIQYVNRIHVRAATVSAEEIKSGAYKTELITGSSADPQLVELMDYLVEIKLPFPSNDYYECWILDSKDQTPLAMLYSCSEAEQMKKFPTQPQWTALPDSIMPVIKTPAEVESKMAPVNYRVESLVSERAGTNKKSRWYDRREYDDSQFPPYLLREDWPEPEQEELLSRYLQRQAPRLLMLQGLTDSQRNTLESGGKLNATEVARFFGLYPKIINAELINALRVEARIRAASSSGNSIDVLERRDGVLYI